jgi:hypothetical protein
VKPKNRLQGRFFTLQTANGVSRKHAEKPQELKFKKKK